MPRASTIDPCLLCGAMPCECNKPARSKKAAPRRKTENVSPDRVSNSTYPTGTVPSVPEPRRQSMVDRMRARAADAPAPPPPPVEPVRAKPTARSSELPELAQDQLLELAALRALTTHFEVEGEAVDRYQTYLDKAPSLAERKTAWKMNRRSDAPVEEASTNGG